MRNNLLRALIVALTVVYSSLAHAADPGTRVAAQSLQISTSVGLLTTSGYSMTGDLGAAHYKRDTSLTTCGFQSADGAFWTLAEAVINPAMCGAIPDDNIDDTAAIRNAMAAATGKTLYIPKGTWNIGATSGTEVLLWDQQMQIVGDGKFSSILLVAASTPDTVDAIRVDPNYPGSTNSGWSIKNLAIVPASGGLTARHGFHIDLDDILGESLSQFVMDNVRIGEFRKRAFSMNKGPEGGTPTNTDGFFLSSVTNSFFWGGPQADAVVFLDNSGDSLYFGRDVGYGPATTGVAIYARPVGGAAQEVFEDWNITAAGGAFSIVDGLQVKLNRLQIEQSFAFTGPIVSGGFGCSIRLRGTTNQTEITGINNHAHGLVHNICFEDTATRNTVRDSMLNGITTAAGNKHFVFTASTARNIAQNNSFYFDNVANSGPKITNLSTDSQPYGVKTVGDAAYAILNTDRVVQTSVALTAQRNWTLPLASSMKAGDRILVQDPVLVLKRLTSTVAVAKSGSDTINGVATSFILNWPGASVEFVTDGVSTWTTDPRLAGTRFLTDADETILATDRTLQTSGSFTAARTKTLPAANLFPLGAQLIFIDAAGTLTSTNTITFARAGSDTFADGATSITLGGKFSTLILQSNGNTVWEVVQVQEQGTYTPTLTNVANLDASTANTTYYRRTGGLLGASSITIWGQVSVDPTANTTLTKLGISLPVASNLTTAFQCGGVGSSTVVGQTGGILGDATNDRAELDFISTDTASRAMQFQFNCLVQ